MPYLTWKLEFLSNILWMILEHKMYSKHFVYLNQYLAGPLLSNNVYCDHMKILAILKYGSQMKFRIMSLFTKINECLMVNLPIPNRTVIIFLETVNLKPLFKWTTNLAKMCLATRGNWLTFEICKNLWCHSFSLQKPFF